MIYRFTPHWLFHFFFFFSLLNGAIFNLQYSILTLFRVDLYGAAHGWWVKRLPLPKMSHTYLAMMKLGTVIPYLKKIQKIY